MSFFKKEPCCKSLERIATALEKIACNTSELVKLVGFFPVFAVIKFKGVEMASIGTVSLEVGKKVPVMLQELRADGSVYSPNPGDVTLSVQDASVLSLVDNGDGTGMLTALAAGVSQVGGADKVTGLSATGTVTVTPVVIVPPPPVGAQIVFGDVTS
jgi:hypothetical protein